MLIMNLVVFRKISLKLEPWLKSINLSQSITRKAPKLKAWETMTWQKLWTKLKILTDWGSIRWTKGTNKSKGFPLRTKNSTSSTAASEMTLSIAESILKTCLSSTQTYFFIYSAGDQSWKIFWVGWRCQESDRQENKSDQSSFQNWGSWDCIHPKHSLWRLRQEIKANVLIFVSFVIYIPN